MKGYKKKAKCYCDNGPYCCEICNPDRKEKRVFKKSVRQKIKKFIEKCLNEL